MESIYFASGHHRAVQCGRSADRAACERDTRLHNIDVTDTETYINFYPEPWAQVSASRGGVIPARHFSWQGVVSSACAVEKTTAASVAEFKADLLRLLPVEHGGNQSGSSSPGLVAAHPD